MISKINPIVFAIRLEALGKREVREKESNHKNGDSEQLKKTTHVLFHIAFFFQLFFIKSIQWVFADLPDL